MSLEPGPSAVSQTRLRTPAQNRGSDVAAPYRLRRGAGHPRVKSRTVLFRSMDMEKPMNHSEKGQAKLKDLVVLTLLSDADQAREYETLLRLNDIPTLLKEQLGPNGEDKGVTIMVPEDCLDEAHVVIESQDAYDDFYDYAIEDDDDIDFDPDYLDDEF